MCPNISSFCVYPIKNTKLYYVSINCHVILFIYANKNNMSCGNQRTRAHFITNVLRVDLNPQFFKQEFFFNLSVTVAQRIAN